MTNTPGGDDHYIPIPDELILGVTAKVTGNSEPDAGSHIASTGGTNEGVSKALSSPKGRDEENPNSPTEIHNSPVG